MLSYKNKKFSNKFEEIKKKLKKTQKTKKK